MARVGYFKTNLQNGIQVELSASRHAGIIHSSFPSAEKHVLVDVSHVSFGSLRDPEHLIDICRRQYLPGSPGDSSSQFYVAGGLHLGSDGKSYQGCGTYIGGWNNGK